MAACNLERNESDFPQKPRRPELFLEAADMQDPYGVGAPLDRPIQRNAVHQAAVVEMLLADLHRRKDAGQRTGSKNRLHEIAAVKPALTRLLDAGRDAFEGYGQFLEGLCGQSLAQHPAKLTTAVQ